VRGRGGLWGGFKNTALSQTQIRTSSTITNLYFSNRTEGEVCVCVCVCSSVTSGRSLSWSGSDGGGVRASETCDGPESDAVESETSEERHNNRYIFNIYHRLKLRHRQRDVLCITSCRSPPPHARRRAAPHWRRRRHPAGGRQPAGGRAHGGGQHGRDGDLLAVDLTWKKKGWHVFKLSPRCLSRSSVKRSSSQG